MTQPKHRVALLLGAGLVLCSFGLMWGLPNLFDFAQDSVVPMGTLAERGFAFDEVTTYRYPPFHFIILRLAFLPVRALLALPAFGENPKLSATFFILSARLVSLAMALGTMGLLYATGRRLWDERTGLVAALVFILSPVTLYYAKNANLDIPYVFWLAAALFFYVRILQENRTRDYLWLGLTAALAVCTKDQAYGFVLLMPLPILHRLWKNGRAENHERPGRLGRIGIAAAAFLIPFILIHNILFDPAAFWNHVKMVAGPGSEGWRLFTRGPIGQLRLLVEDSLCLMDAWTPAGLALVVIGLVMGLRHNERRYVRLAILLPAVSYHLFFLGVIGYVYPRFVLPMMLVFSLFAGHAVNWLWGLSGRARARQPGGFAGPALAVGLVAWIGLAGLALDYVMSDYSRYHAQMWLEKNVPEGVRVAYLGDMRDMPRFNEPLDPIPCEPDQAALERSGAEVLVLSFGPGHPAVGPGATRLASVLRRSLGRWGRADVRGGATPPRDFRTRLVAGELGYVECVRFKSRIARFVPEVAESVNRSIVILTRKET